MRLGILGGTFDPIHYGHLLLAESCREQLGLGQVWFLPAAVPPHKQRRQLAPAAERVEMIELAIGGHEALALLSVQTNFVRVTSSTRDWRAPRCHCTRIGL